MKQLSLLDYVAPTQTQTGYIYRITFNDGYVYVGSTTQTVAVRMSNHLSAIRKGAHEIVALAAKMRAMNFEYQVTSFPFSYNEVTQLREREYIEMGYVPSDKLINERVNYKGSADNDWSTPVSTSEWVKMLYPEKG